MPFSHVSVTGARLAGAPYFTPGYIINGKEISAKAEFNVYVNDRDKADTFKVTAWGMQAVRVARNGAKGKEISFSGHLNSYLGRVYAQSVNGQAPVAYMAGDGTPITTRKCGITLERHHFGADSTDTELQEIQEYVTSQGRSLGGRPPFWNAKNHADNQIWKAICDARNKAQYVPGSQRFGYAIVRPIPQGAVEKPMEYKTYNNGANANVVNANTGQAVTYGDQNLGQPLNQQYHGNTHAVGSSLPSGPTQNGGYVANTQPANNGWGTAPIQNNGPVNNGQGSTTFYG